MNTSYRYATATAARSIQEFTAILLVVLFCHNAFAQIAATKSFESPNGRRRVVIEDIDPQNPEFNDRKLLAVVYNIEAGGSKELWRTTFKGTVLDVFSRGLIPDDGDFIFLQLSGERMGDLISRTGQQKSIEIADSSWYDSIFETDVWKGEPVLRIWLDKEDEWRAFSGATFAQIKVTPEMTAQWNRQTRHRIVEIFARREQERLRQKLAEFSPPLARALDVAIPMAKTYCVSREECSFLVHRRVPDDRKWFENMIRKQPILPGPVMPLIGCGVGHTREGDYSVEEFDRDRLLGNRMLGEWYSHNEVRMAADDSISLGRAHGIVKLPVPVISKPGLIRIFLIPESEVHVDWSTAFETEKIERPLPEPNGEEVDLVDEIPFYFQTVTPGKYFAKAIWDKRSPMTDRQNAGPGDYESSLSGPYTFSDNDDEGISIDLQCTNRVAGGNAYYAADELVVRKWKIIGDLGPGNFEAGGDWTEQFSARAEKWIVKTNSLDGDAAIARISFGFSKLEGPALRVHLRGHGLAGLEIKSADGRVYTSASSDFQAGKNFRFGEFPHEPGCFRIIAKDRYWQKVQFDFTLTNLVAAKFPNLAH